MQRSHVAVANEYFRVAPDERVIEERQESCGSVATPKAEDPLHFGVGEHSHQVAGAVGIRPRKKTVTVTGVAGEAWLEAELPQSVNSLINAGWICRSATGGNDPHPIARSQRRRAEP